MSCARAPETDFLQWGNRKRSRCFKVKKDDILKKPIGVSTKRAYSRLARAEKDAAPLPLNRKRSKKILFF